MTVRGVSQNVIATSGEASVTSQEFGGEVVSVTINTYEAGKQPWYDSWQQPISWSDMRKYFDPVFGVDARRLIDDLESNVQSLEDYLDTAFIKTYGGVAQGVIKFLQGIQVSGPYGLGYISFVGSTGSAIDYTGLMNITGITTGSSNYLTLNSEGMIIKSNRSGVDPYITFVDYPSISGDSATLTRKGTGSAARLELDNNLTISARNPVVRIEETGPNDNVDLELMQTGTNAEGLRLRYESNTGHSRITNIFATGHLYLNTNNQTANGIIINSGGQVQMPSQPVFKAHMNAATLVNATAILPLDATSLNVGGCYNTTNYRFTAPVSGSYFFGGMIRVNADNAYIHSLPVINGVANRQYDELPALTAAGGSGLGFTAGSWTFVRYLSAGDYIQFLVYWFSGGPYNIHPQTYTVGYLIG